MPSLSYNAMLKKTGVELDLFEDQEMADFFIKVNMFFNFFVLSEKSLKLKIKHAIFSYRI